MKNIPLTKGKFAIVDDGDYEKLSKFRWQYMAVGYAIRWWKKKGKQGHRYMHHELLPPKKGFETDHANGDRLDNRRSNLRYCTRTQNNGNRGKVSGCVKNGKQIRFTSRYKGVHFMKDKPRTKPWEARICHQHKVYSLGCFAVEEEAAKAYNRKAIELFGEFAKLNFSKNLGGGGQG